MTALETDCIQYLEDLVRLPIYPRDLEDCAGLKKKFCEEVKVMLQRNSQL